MRNSIVTILIFLFGFNFSPGTLAQKPVCCIKIENNEEMGEAVKFFLAQVWGADLDNLDVAHRFVKGTFGNNSENRFIGIIRAGSLYTVVLSFESNCKEASYYKLSVCELPFTDERYSGPCYPDPISVFFEDVNKDGIKELLYIYTNCLRTFYEGGNGPYAGVEIEYQTVVIEEQGNKLVNLEEWSKKLTYNYFRVKGTVSEESEYDSMSQAQHQNYLKKQGVTINAEMVRKRLGKMQVVD
jgi:hypothetical protein